MRKLNDPMLQMLLTYVARDAAISAPAQQSLQDALLKLDAELAVLRATPAPSEIPSLEAAFDVTTEAKAGRKR